MAVVGSLGVRAKVVDGIVFGHGVCAQVVDGIVFKEID